MIICKWIWSSKNTQRNEHPEKMSRWWNDDKHILYHFMIFYDILFNTWSPCKWWFRYCTPACSPVIPAPWLKKSQRFSTIPVVELSSSSRKTRAAIMMNDTSVQGEVLKLQIFTNWQSCLDHWWSHCSFWTVCPNPDLCVDFPQLPLELPASPPREAAEVSLADRNRPRDTPGRVMSSATDLWDSGKAPSDWWSWLQHHLRTGRNIADLSSCISADVLVCIYSLYAVNSVPNFWHPSILLTISGRCSKRNKWRHWGATFTNMLFLVYLCLQCQTFWDR